MLSSTQALSLQRRTFFGVTFSLLFHLLSRWLIVERTLPLNYIISTLKVNRVKKPNLSHNLAMKSAKNTPKNTTVFNKKYAKLNAKQKEAVDAIEGPVMVIAGPGTGKTTVLTLRIANILLTVPGIKPEEILALTFTESGVRAMREKLREIIGDTSFRVNIFTFHGFANYIRSRYPENFEKIGGRIPASSADSVEIIEDILKKESFRELRSSTFGVKISEILKRIGELKKEAIYPDDLLERIEKAKRAQKEYVKSLDEVNKTKASEIEKKEKYLRRMEEFQKTYVLYEKELEKRALYDYDDTILGLISALKKNPDLQAEMRESFQYVLADEHQDANGAQNEILKFFRGVELDAIDPPNIFVVGDDKQSIFRFQGASLENFYQFENDFKGVKKINLTENYRSHSHILETTHHLIKHDGNDHTKLNANVSYEIKPIEVDEYESFEDELSGTVEKIKKELVRNNKDTVAVISRTNGALFELARYLEKEKIAYSLAGEKSLFETDTFIRLSYLFGAMTEPMEDAKFIPAMYFGYFKNNLHDILTLENHAKKTRTTLANIILKNEVTGILLEDQKGFESLSEEIKELITDAKKLPLLKMLQKLGEKMVDVADSEALVVLRELFEEADKLVLKKRNALLIDFVEYLAMLQRHNLSPIIQSKEKKERLELLSIHKSKGLEYDFVHVIDVTDKKFEKMGRKGDLLALPDIEDDMEDEKTIAENRRLLYVAITRAKQHAVLSYSLKGGQDQAQTPSVLLDELLPELTKKEVVGEKIKKISLFGVEEKAPQDIKKILQDEFLKKSFSVTALNNFLSCPWKYFFRNLLQIPDVKEFSAMLGTACHEALRHFHQLVKKGKKVSVGELKKIIKDAVYAQAFSKGDLSVALERAQESVEAYVKSFKVFDEEEKVYIEERMSFPLKIETGKVDFEILITGVLDLVVEGGGHSHVIDFKTKKRMTLNEIMGKTKNSTGDYFRQLQFYKLLWENAGKGSVVDRASLSFLTPERGEVSMETFELEEKDKNEIEKILIETLREIHSFSFWNKKCEDKKCEYCQMAEVFKENTL